VVAVIVFVVKLFECISPLTPRPPLIINAPEPVLVAAVVLAIII
jgi:hypothetical protein